MGSVAVHRARASAIRFEAVSKVYPHASHPAVEAVTFTVEPGEFAVLLGPSGCGKTTLLKLANRLLEPSSGRVVMDGRDLRDIPGHLLRRHIGYVIQQTGLFPHMRVEENVAVVPQLLGWDTERTSRRINELLELVGLSPVQFRKRYPGQLSGGEQQRVGLARALAAGPSTLLMDEPFGALDAIARTRLQEELLAIHRRLGQTVIFVTHDVEEAMRLADRIAVMRSGRIEQYDKPACVLMSPENTFVADLLGSRDVLRRLGLMPVSAAIAPLNARELIDEGPSISSSADLRSALAALLEAKGGELLVRDQDGIAIGRLDMDGIRAAISSQRQDPRGGGPA